MSPIVTSCLLLAVIIGLTSPSSAEPMPTFPTYRCRLFEEVKDTSLCPHGADRNACGKMSCLKGLNESCGISRMEAILEGSCANGLLCCGTCLGCLNNHECSEDMCRPNKRIINEKSSRLQQLLALLDSRTPFY